MGNLDSITDPNGNLTTMSFGKDRRLRTVTPPAPTGGAGILSTWEVLDADGKPLNVTRASGAASVPNQITTYTYTPTGRIATSTDASNDTLTYTYDVDDRLVGVTDGTGHSKGTVYDSDNRPAALCVGIGTIVAASPCQNDTTIEQRSYTPNGFVQARQYFVNGGWQSTTYVRDPLDRLGQITYPDATFETNVYDLSDDLLSHTSRRNETVSWAYDGLHRRVSRTGALSETYGYDLASNLLSATVATAAQGVPAGTWASTYDTAGRRATDVGTLGRVTYSWDKNGNLTYLHYPDTNAFAMTYDARNRALSGFMFNGANANTLWTDSYDPFDRISGRQLSPTQFTNWTYANGPYTTSGAGLDVVRVFNSLSASVSADYHYQFDAAHRLIGQTTGGSAVLAHPTTSNTLAGLTANNDNELLNSTPGQVLKYGINGNLSYDGPLTYVYDSDGDDRILSATIHSTAASYGYDAFGRRISKTVNGTTTQYLLDFAGREIGEYDGSGNLVRRLTYDPQTTAPVASLDPSFNATYNETDRSGSVIATTSGANAGSIYAYLPYGDTPSGTLTGTAFGYAGYRFDAETGVYHTRTRSYDPRLGRFLQVDPIGQAGGVNIYAYTNDNPLNGSDIAGTSPNGACDGPCNSNSYSAVSQVSGSGHWVTSCQGGSCGEHGNGQWTTVWVPNPGQSSTTEAQPSQTSHQSSGTQITAMAGTSLSLATSFAGATTQTSDFGTGLAAAVGAGLGSEAAKALAKLGAAEGAEAGAAVGGPAAAVIGAVAGAVGGYITGFGITAVAHYLQNQNQTPHTDDGVTGGNQSQGGNTQSQGGDFSSHEDATGH